MVVADDKLFKMEYEMAFNHGRPAISFGEDTIKHARRLLDHPLSIKSDSRLIPYNEMMAFRSEYTSRS